MEFLSAYYWNRGKRRKNEDSLTVQSVLTKRGPLYMACICDGIGGLGQGEFASGYIVEALTNWFYEELIKHTQAGILSRNIRKSYCRKLYSIHEELKKYGEKKGKQLGSTCTCLVLTRKEYYIFYVGDTSVYRIRRKARLLTKDHVKGERVLTQCIGSGIWKKPDCIRGSYRKEEGFLVCSDGYRRDMKKEALEMVFGIGTTGKDDTRRIKMRMEEIGKRNLQRGERDNMSAIYVKRMR